MTCFSEILTTPSKLNPFKRVKYSLGMVLGLDEFEQEQTYFLERGRLQNQSLHGYGTVCGLQLTQEGRHVRVSPGLAINPRGEEIRLPAGYCADLDKWLSLDENLQEVILRHGADPGSLSLYFSICSRECGTDELPVPGEPCRSQEDSAVASRITESFALKLSLDPPDQKEEVAVRSFGDLLFQVQIEAGQPFATREEMERRVRDLALESGPGSFPEGPLFLDPEQAEDILKACFRIWVTEVRPRILAEDCCAACEEKCVLLGRLGFAVARVAGVLRVAEGAIDIGEEERPYILSTRLLQEFLLNRQKQAFGHHGDPAGGDLGGTYPAPTVEGFRGHPLQDKDPSTAGEVWVWNPSSPVIDPDLPPPVPPDPGPVQPQYELRKLSLDDLGDVDTAGAAIGNALVFDGETWAPGRAGATGNFVQRMARPYYMVAAGWAFWRGNPRSLSVIIGYNDLKVSSLGVGLYNVFWTGYSTPNLENPTWAYILKAMSMKGKSEVVFEVLAFEKGGVRIATTGRNSELVDVDFMIEVSAFGEVPNVEI